MPKCRWCKDTGVYVGLGMDAPKPCAECSREEGEILEVPDPPVHTWKFTYNARILDDQMKQLEEKEKRMMQDSIRIARKLGSAFFKASEADLLELFVGQQGGKLKP